MFLIISLILFFPLCFSISSPFLRLLFCLPHPLMLSRPPEGSAFERHENQSLPPSRLPLFHLTMTCFLERGVVVLKPSSFVHSLSSFWEAQSIHFKNKSLVISLRWMRAINAAPAWPCPTCLCKHVVICIAIGAGRKSNLGWPCF